MEALIIIVVFLVVWGVSLVMLGKVAEWSNTLEEERQRRLEEKARCPACRQIARHREFKEGKCPECGERVMDPHTLEMT